LITVKQGRERGREGLESLVESLQSAFETSGIPEEDGEQVDDLVMPKAPSPHAFTESRKDPLLAKVLDYHSYFAKPGGHRRDRLRRTPYRVLCKAKALKSGAVERILQA
jgi:hypothetical protein